MDLEKVQKWADILVNHSLARQFERNHGEKGTRGKIVIVEGEVCTEPLMIALEEEIIKAGGFPVLMPFFSNRNRRNIFAGVPVLKYGNETQKDFIPSPYIDLALMADAFITILGSEDPHAFEDHLDGLKDLKISGARFDKKRFDKIWTLTHFPTRAEAKDEGMDYDEYCNFFLDSCLSDYTDMEEKSQELIRLIDESDSLKIRTYYPKEDRILELEMDISGNLACGLFGEINVPDGEILTSPHANSVTGEVYLDIPVLHGAVIGGAYMRFEEGKVVDFDAEQGYEALKEIIETDEGSCMIGEFAFGVNTNINREFNNILYTEKIGGTIHFALGKSYDEPFSELAGLQGLEKEMVRNQLIQEGRYVNSAQHVDIPKDLREPKEGEGVFLDDRKVEWDGTKWLLTQETLNFIKHP